MRAVPGRPLPPFRSRSRWRMMADPRNCRRAPAYARLPTTPMSHGAPITADLPGNLPPQIEAVHLPVNNRAQPLKLPGQHGGLHRPRARMIKY